MSSSAHSSFSARVESGGSFMVITALAQEVVGEFGLRLAASGGCERSRHALFQFSLQHRTLTEDPTERRPEHPGIDPACSRENGSGGRILRMLPAGPDALIRTPRRRISLTTPEASSPSGSLVARSLTKSKRDEKPAAAHITDALVRVPAEPAFRQAALRRTASRFRSASRPRSRTARPRRLQSIRGWHRMY